MKEYLTRSDDDFKKLLDWFKEKGKSDAEDAKIYLEKIKPGLVEKNNNEAILKLEEENK